MGSHILPPSCVISPVQCCKVLQPVSTFDAECLSLNLEYGKNKSASEIKSHHYIISFDPKDSAEGSLTMQEAQRIGMDYAKRNFPGHQALVCTHADGEEHSGNIHVHIIINSLRKHDVEKQSFMERDCDSKAGFLSRTSIP